MSSRVDGTSVSSVTHNVTNHPAATKDCPSKNARLRRSGALDCFAGVGSRPRPTMPHYPTLQVILIVVLRRVHFHRDAVVLKAD